MESAFDVMGLLDRFEELLRPEAHETDDGLELWDRPLALPPAEPTPKHLVLHSLGSLCDYVRANPDNVSMGRCVLRLSYDSALLAGPLSGRHRQREHYAKAVPLVTSDLASAGQYRDLDAFRVWVMTSFVADDAQRQLLDFCSSIVVSDETTVRDDGVAQQVVVKKGASGAWETVPGEVALRPWCTFAELEQPLRDFRLRIRGEGTHMQAALFETSNPAWLVGAAAAAEAYVNERLAGLGEEDAPAVLA